MWQGESCCSSNPNSGLRLEVELLPPPPLHTRHSSPATPSPCPPHPDFSATLLTFSPHGRLCPWPRSSGVSTAVPAWPCTRNREKGNWGSLRLQGRQAQWGVEKRGQAAGAGCLPLSLSTHYLHTACPPHHISPHILQLWWGGKFKMITQ